jgi:hypothetical protein
MRLLALILGLSLIGASAAEAAPHRQFRVSYRIVRISNGLETPITEGVRRLDDRAEPVPEAPDPSRAEDADDATGLLAAPLAYVERSLRDVARAVTGPLRGFALLRRPVPDDGEHGATFDPPGENWTYRWRKKGDPAAVSYRLDAVITPIHGR